ncbi:MAG TPA: hypothetical protein VGO48_08490 [Conexibacter sp.]|nr:hypothetical protein [Conexibacter sp.]
MKSPPELWAEVSDAASLARHLGEVGEITITRLEPETTVAWEGERASGTVELAPAGWGTSVTLTAEPVATADEPPTPEPAPEPIAVAEPEPEPATIAEPEPEREPAAAAEPEAVADATPARRSWLARIFSRTPKPPTAPEPQPSATDADRAGGDEDARPAAEGRTGAHPEGHRPRSGWSGPARQAAEPEREERAAPEPEPKDPLHDVLTQALDSLGQAHHRPFSRG